MKQLILTAVLIIPALGYAAYRDARPEAVASSYGPDVICAEVCVQLVPWRVRMGSYEPGDTGGS